MNSIADILGYDTPVTGLASSEPPVTQKPEETNGNEEDNKHMAQAKAVINGIRDQLDAVLRLLDGQDGGLRADIADAIVLHTGERIIEGVFNGQKMVGSDGNEYLVPPNYASKSKLVEGDMMKLTITKSGSFIYKQIGPIERKRLAGELVSGDGKDQWRVLADGRTYKILTASVTFYKGTAGDEIFILVPEDGQSDWAAVENIIKK